MFSHRGDAHNMADEYIMEELVRVFGVGEADVASHPATEVTQREANVKARRKSLSKSVAEGSEVDRKPLIRHSFPLARMAEEQRARKVRFYRNGDRFFKGMVIAVSTQRFRNYENLLNTLTMSPLCDKNVMPCGVRHIFTSDGAKRIDSLDQLEDGESYVCASTEVFRSLDYSRTETPVWNRDVVTNGSASHGKLSHSQLQQQYLQQQRQQQNDREGTAKTRSLSSHSQHNRKEDSRPSSGRVKSSKSEMTPTERANYEGYMRSFVVPRLITVVRQGKKPRKSVRLLLNSKTAKTIDQVLDDIAESIRMDCGNIKKLYTMSGRQVTCLRHFFEEESVFLACGSDKPSPEDFVIDPREVRQVYAYRLNKCPRIKSRITLRSSTSSRGLQTPSSSKSKISGVYSISSRSTPLNSIRESSKKDDLDDRTISSSTLDGDSEESLKMPMTLTNKYEIGAVIGTGNFAVVHECRERKSNKMFALKIMNKNSCKDREKMLENEIRILRRLNHPNIIRLVEDYVFQQRIYYVMDLIKGGDLFDAICSSRKYTEQDARSIVFNLASALDYLHGLKIVHRDVKPENILIRVFDDGTKSLKLGDFGLATEVKTPLYAVCGTPSYVAPEVISELGYNIKVDIWSMGVITYILLCGFPPFASPNDDQEELFDLILAGNIDFPSPYWDSVKPSAKDLILSMLDKEQDFRYTARQVLDHTWIVEDTACNEDLHSIVSSGLTTNFRRSTQSIKQRGIQVIVKSALDKSKHCFRGRGTTKRVRGPD